MKITRQGNVLNGIKKNHTPRKCFERNKKKYTSMKYFELNIRCRIASDRDTS